MSSFTPPLAFGNRAFYGHRAPEGAVVVIDSPREIDRSDVPIDPTRDVVAHAAFLAAPVGVQLLRRGFRGFLGVDAGIGRNEAGIGALPLADGLGVPAAAVSVYSCDMCDGGSVWRDGVISRANGAALALGVEPGQGTEQAAVLMLRASPGRPRTVAVALPDQDFVLKPGQDGGVFGCWSMSLVHDERARDVFCVGTPVDTTMTVYVYRHGIRPAGIIGSDGGFGRHQMAVAGLYILEKMGIACVAVSHLSADLGDPRSIYQDGRISLVNQQARAAGLAVGMAAAAGAEGCCGRNMPMREDQADERRFVFEAESGHWPGARILLTQSARLCEAGAKPPQSSDREETNWPRRSRGLSAPPWTRRASALCIIASSR